MTDITIRTLRDEDIPELTKIESESFSMPWSADDFRHLLEVSDAIYLVAVSDGAVLGSAGMRIICGEGNIDNVVVRQSARGQGIGTGLIMSLLAEGRRNGANAFTLEVRKSNTPAIKLYENAGFESAGIRPNFYERPTEDAIIYWLRDQDPTET